jgi:hypothetical protein
VALSPHTKVQVEVHVVTAAQRLPLAT